MAQEKRSAITEKSGKLESGLMLAKVVGYLDPSFMGGLEVTLLREQGNTIGDLNQTYPVKYASPFYGVTGYEYMGLNKDDFNDTQKSYGMWFPCPEIGTTVIVVFIDGNPAEGYWVACVPSRFMNHMIPAIGGSTEVELNADDKKKYDTTQPLPVAEVNRKANTLEKSLNIEKIKKPVHPIADRFLEQGLLEDDVRGVTTSTSRRNVPNNVFGISTPGPFDRRSGAKKQFIGKKQSQSPATVPVSRLGGTTMVFDDGDDQYQRKTPAGKGPVEYADTLAGEKGDPTIPYNEYFRVRTRTGHQILMHNSEDLIYIGNARGTTWIELTSNGKVDIYAEDSISIHTEQDLNFRADRDINLEAGRNVNIKSEKGRLHADVAANLEIVIGKNGLITTAGNIDINTTGNNTITAGGMLDVKSGSTTKVTAGGDASIGGANLIFSGGRIDLNGPAAPPAATAATTALLSTHDNPVTSSKEKWDGKNRYAVKAPLKSIMKRIPMHEPWVLHENQAPQFLTPEATDRDVKD
jgi:starvation-inducible outer membrane lipoprotein